MSDALNLDEIEARAKAAAALAEQATAGPWGYDADCEYLYSKAPHLNTDDAEPWAGRITSWPADWPFLTESTDLDFIAAARTDVPALAADVQALLADRARLAAQLATARALLMDCWHQLDGDVYVLPGGEVHPGAVTTIHALHAFLWPEGKTI